MKRIGLTLLGILLNIMLFAQTGTVTGTVTEMMNDKVEPVPFANVFLLGTTTGGTTDFDGKYTFAAPVGTHKLVVSYTGYEADTFQVNVTDGGTVTQDIQVRKKSFALEEFKVVGKVNRESEGVLLMERQNAQALEEKIGSTELSKKGAGDVQEGLAKMSGVSQVGAGAVLVRGLGDRYNNAYLNGIPLPSPDPDRKVIPLDIIPTDVVQSLTVAKTFTPSQFGDVAGASIDIRTKDYADQKTLEVSSGLGYNTNNFGTNFLTYNGGGNDYFGFDDGTRDVPSNLNPQWFQLESPSKVLYNSNDPSKNPSYPGIPFAKNFNPVTKTTPMNSSFGIKAGNFYGKDNNQKGFGFLVLGSLENKSNNVNGLYRVVNAQDAKIIDYTYDKSVQSTNMSALGTMYYRFNTENNIKFNTMFVNLSNDASRETDGYHWDYDNIGEIFTRRFTWRQNKLWSNQLMGHHELMDKKLTIEWNGAYQVTGSKEPDRRQLIWNHQPGDARSEYQFHTFDIADQHRFYMYLEEQEFDFGFSGSYILKADSNEKALSTLSAGYQGRIKSRRQDFKFYSHNFKDFNTIADVSSVDADNPDAYITDEYHELGAFWQRQESRPESATEGTLNVHGAYANIDYHFNEKWYAMAGLRVEKSFQEIRYRKQSSPLDPMFVESEVIDTLNFLPMASLKYSPNKKSSVRAVFSQTVTRPNFKELAPFQYRQFFGGTVNQGNPFLQNSSNTNIDVRYEYYPKSGDLYSATVFARRIKNPIEQVTQGSASGILISYQNALSAEAYGIELEYIKKLRNMVSKDSPLRFFSVGANFSYIYSKVAIDTTQAGVINNDSERPLQGASPILVNADLSYEKRFSEGYKTSVTASYNYFSKRLFSVGRQNIGDSYELGVNTINLTWKNDFGQHWAFNVSVGNLLNPDIQIEQESTQGNPPTLLNTYKRGTTFGGTLVYKVFKSN